LVEDSILTEQLLRDGVQKIPFPLTLSSVATPQEAIEAIARNRPDIILLDVHLKGGSGFTVLREAIKHEPRPTIVMVTNFALPPYRKYAMLSGADYFLDKALNLDHVPTLVEWLVRKRFEATAP